MKKKFEKKYAVVVKTVAHMLSQNPTEDEALQRLRELPRRERRLIQRLGKKQEKKKHEEAAPGTNTPPIS